MWFILFLTVVNSVTSSRGFQNLYRISLGPIQIGVLETTLALAVLLGFLQGGKLRSMTPTLRTHPGYLWCIGLLLVGFLFGAAGMMTHQAELKAKLIFMREWIGMPAAVFVGYQLIGTMKMARRLPYAIIVGGVLVSVMLMKAFDEGSERYEIYGDWGALRSVSFVTNYAGVAACFLLYSVIAKLRLLPNWLALVLAGFCFVGQLTPLHRSDWMAQIFGIMALPLCLPPGDRLRNVFRIVISVVVLGISLYAGLWLASAVTGRNFHKTFDDRVKSLLPGERIKKSDGKAWDSRLPAIHVELGIWLTSPVFGRGFAIEEAGGPAAAAAVGWGFHHNCYTSTLAQAGLIGLVGYLLAIWGPVVVGYRMLRDRTDKTSMMIGALGILAGVQEGTLGMMTASFNGYRHAMLIGLIAGVVYRVREMQLAAKLNAEQYGDADEDQFDGEQYLPVDEQPFIPEYTGY